MRLRALSVPFLAAALLVAPLPGPAAAAEVVYDPVSVEVDGLPADEAAPDEAPPESSAGSVDGEASTWSEPVEADIPFTMLGFKVPEGADLDFRTSADGTSWSEWTSVEAADEDTIGPDEGSAEDRLAGDDGRRPTDAYWVGESSHLQVAVHGGSTEDVEVSFIDTEGHSFSWSEKVAATLRSVLEPGHAPAVAAVSRPAIVSRAQWGANESWRRGSSSYASNVRYTIVHHTANANTYTQAQAAGVVRGIYQWHTQGNGWSDMGYNILVDRYGTIYEGRHGGVDRAVVGAHAGGFNTASFGVSIIGTFSTASVPSAALTSLERVVAWKSQIHGFDPKGSLTVTSGGSNRFPAGRQVTLRTISGHRDVGLTDCPGNVLYGYLPTLRDRAAALRGSSGSSPAPAPSPAPSPTPSPAPAPAPSTPSGAIPIAGDWNGDGKSTPGWFKDGRISLRNSLTSGSATIVYTYGKAGDVPVVGDWNGNGRDTVAIIRDRVWHIRNSLSAGAADLSFTYGRLTAGDLPLAGDWNGNGRDTPGIVRVGEWHLRNSLSSGPSDLAFTYGRVLSGDVPLVGDWSGDGTDTPAIVRNAEWHLRFTNTPGPASITFPWGLPTDFPLSGSWNGSRWVTGGLVRGSTWYLTNAHSGPAQMVLTFSP